MKSLVFLSLMTIACTCFANDIGQSNNPAKSSPTVLTSMNAPQHVQARWRCRHWSNTCWIGRYGHRHCVSRCDY